jgi:hypothetical protein
MIRGHSINMLHHIDQHEKFKVMDLIVETIKRIAADQKRSCGFAPHIQLLINSKGANKSFLLDHEHLPLRPEFEDNTVTMDASHPTSAEPQGSAEAARTSGPSAPSSPVLKTKTDQMNHLLRATQRTEKSLADLAANQKSLEKIVETKFDDLDIKVPEIQTIVETLKSQVDEVRKGTSSDDEEHQGTGLPSTTQFQRMPRSTVMPVASRATVSAPAAPSIVPPSVPPVSTPPAPQTLAEIFANALLSTPTTSTHTGAASQWTSSPGATGDQA